MKDATLEPRPQELWLAAEAGGNPQLLGLMTLKEAVMNQWSSASRDHDSTERHNMVVPWSAWLRLPVDQPLDRSKHDA